jgi:hypothetical protein
MFNALISREQHIKAGVLRGVSKSPLLSLSQPSSFASFTV